MVEAQSYKTQRLGGKMAAAFLHQGCGEERLWGESLEKLCPDGWTRQHFAVLKYATGSDLPMDWCSR